MVVQTSQAQQNAVSVGNVITMNVRTKMFAIKQRAVDGKHGKVVTTRPQQNAVSVGHVITTSVRTKVCAIKERAVNGTNGIMLVYVQTRT